MVSDEDIAKYSISLKEYRNRIVELNTAKQNNIEIEDANKEQYKAQIAEQREKEKII